jgi:hypothetical protein
MCLSKPKIEQPPLPPVQSAVNSAATESIANVESNARRRRAALSRSRTQGEGASGAGTGAKTKLGE